MYDEEVYIRWRDKKEKELRDSCIYNYKCKDEWCVKDYYKDCQKWKEK